MTDFLSDTDHGVWLVHTNHSLHIIDLDARTVERQTVLGYDRARDREPIPLILLARCEVGHSAVMYLEGDEVVTTRVERIEVAG